MKVCKIILIIILAIKSLYNILKIFLLDDGEEQLKQLGAVLIGLPIAWGLYAGAGILNID